MQEKIQPGACVHAPRAVLVFALASETLPTPSGVFSCHGTDASVVTPIFTRPPSPGAFGKSQNEPSYDGAGAGGAVHVVPRSMRLGVNARADFKANMPSLL